MQEFHERANEHFYIQPKLGELILLLILEAGGAIGVDKSHFPLCHFVCARYAVVCISLIPLCASL